MRFFDEHELLKFDSLLADIENRTKDDADLIAKLSKYSIPIAGDISEILATDPRSDAYIEKIKSVHEDIIGKKHSFRMEGLPGLNLEHERRWPFPWGTRSASMVGRFLVAYGFLLQVADLSSGARILEVGCGMGSLTWNLARMGYRVDALDPNATQCEYVASMTRDFPTAPNVVQMTLDDWITAKLETYKYDAVIFFESFHHILNHRECLERLISEHVEVGGKIILAAEPIVDKVSEILPYQWGPRLDGESLRAMRKWGWLELGFTRSYIKRLFNDVGLQFESFNLRDGGPLCRIIVGKPFP